MKTNYNLRWQNINPSSILKKKNTLTIVFLSLVFMLSFSLQTQAQFIEGFETEIPPSWSVINNGDANGWVQQTDPAGGAQEGTGVASISFSSTAHDDYLITPQITVSSGVNERFSYFIRSRSGFFAEPYEVLLSTTDATAESFTTVLQPSSDAPDSWIQDVFDLSSYDGQSVYIAIHATGTDEFELFVDNVVSDAIPSCLKPSELTATNIASTSADLSWTENGSATVWDIEWGATGFAPTGIPTDENVSNPYALDGLSLGTSYDYYVRAECDVDDESTWAGPFTFSTPPANDECSQSIALTVNSDLDCSNVTSGTTVGATASSQADDVTGTPDNDVWFSFVATQTQHQISLENVVAVTGFSTDMGMGLYDGTDGCDALNFVDDSDPNMLLANGLTIGSTYFVRVYGWSSTNSAQTTFDICVGTLPEPPANDDLCDAIALTVDATSDGDAYTNVSATAQPDEPEPACFDNGLVGTVWFTFVAPASGSVEVSTDIDGGTMIDTEVAVYEAPTDCADLTTLGSELGCDQDGGSIGDGWLSTLNLANLTPGDTYYVQVDQWSGTSQGGTFGIEVKESSASVQIIHNSPDPAAASVDVYLNGELLPDLEDVNFRAASPFASIPAGVDITVDVVPAGADISASVFTQTFNLDADESYIIVANGVLDPAGFETDNGFELSVFAGAKTTADDPTGVEVLVHHGSPDAPAVDVNEPDAGNLVSDIAYPEFQGYLPLPLADYVLEIAPAGSPDALVSYSAPLATLGDLLEGAAFTVIASGFLGDDAGPDNGFGLWVALPSGGALVPLDETLSTTNFDDINFSFYPNPTQGRISLETTGQVESIKVFNILGQEMMSERPNSVSPTLRVDGLPTGTYIMNVTIDGTSANFRFIKK